MSRLIPLFSCTTRWTPATSARRADSTRESSAAPLVVSAFALAKRAATSTMSVDVYFLLRPRTDRASDVLGLARRRWRPSESAHHGKQHTRQKPKSASGAGPSLLPAGRCCPMLAAPCRPFAFPARFASVTLRSNYSSCELSARDGCGSPPRPGGAQGAFARLHTFDKKKWCGSFVSHRCAPTPAVCDWRALACSYSSQPLPDTLFFCMPSSFRLRSRRFLPSRPRRRRSRTPLA